MRKTLLVAKREYLETVKTKTFLMGVMMTPLMIAGIILVTKMMEGRSEKEALPDRVVVVADRTGQLAELFRQQFGKHNEQFPDQQIVYEEFRAEHQPPEEAIETVKERIRNDQVKALLLIDSGVLSEHGEAKLYTNKASDMEFPRLIRDQVRAAVRARRAVDLNLSPKTLRELTAPVEITQFDVSAEGEQAVDHIAGFMAPFAFMFLMFTGVFGVSQGLLTSVIEEKTSRIMEVLLSGLSSLQLMAGKILGMACVGMTLMGLWVTAGYLTARHQNLEYLLHVAYPGWLLAYYLLGFLLLSSVLAALGSSVNSLKEAQSLMSPITIVMIVPMIAWFFIMQYPNSTWVVLLSFVPPITPLVMVLRLSGAQTVPAWQLPATMAVLASAALGTVWLASRIFRVGVLMYGKSPTPREILRWVTYR